MVGFPIGDLCEPVPVCFCIVKLRLQAGFFLVYSLFLLVPEIYTTFNLKPEDNGIMCLYFYIMFHFIFFIQSGTSHTWIILT